MSHDIIYERPHKYSKNWCVTQSWIKCQSFRFSSVVENFDQTAARYFIDVSAPITLNYFACTVKPYARPPSGPQICGQFWQLFRIGIPKWKSELPCGCYSEVGSLTRVWLYEHSSLIAFNEEFQLKIFKHTSVYAYYFPFFLFCPRG